MKKVSKPAEWMGEQVEAFVDGELSREERAVFVAALEGDLALRDEVERAHEVKRALRAIRTPACPPEVTAGVFAHVRSDRNHVSGGWRRVVDSWWIRRPMLVAAAVVVIALLFTSPWRPSPPASPSQYADAEVQVALDEVRWTLAYLNDVGSRTGKTIRKEAFSEGVVRPIQYGLGLTDEPIRQHRQN